MSHHPPIATLAARARLAAAAALMPLALGMAGCSELVYDMRQESALRACDQIIPVDERLACRRRNSTRYDQYEKERSKVTAAGGQPPVGKAAPGQDKSLCFTRASTGETVCPN